jgi:hypothetical protein
MSRLTHGRAPRYAGFAAPHWAAGCESLNDGAARSRARKPCGFFVGPACPNHGRSGWETERFAGAPPVSHTRPVPPALVREGGGSITAIGACIMSNPTQDAPASDNSPDSNRYIRVKRDFFYHFKTRKLIKRLGLSGAVSLVKLWTYAMEFKPDGVLSGMSDEAIAIAVDWEGDPSLFVSTLLKLRFLDDNNGTLSIHDWLEHQPHALRARAERPYPRDWNQRRYTVFLRDDFTCRYCGVRIELPHCDHVMPRSRGGSDDVSNLVTACPDCNRRKHAKTPYEWMQ